MSLVIVDLNLNQTVHVLHKDYVLSAAVHQLVRQAAHV